MTKHLSGEVPEFDGNLGKHFIIHLHGTLRNGRTNDPQ